MMKSPAVKRFASIDTLSRAAADQIAMLASRGECNIALSGGSTPKRMFQILAERGKKAVAWDNVNLWWGDERCVPPDHPDSNFGMTKANLIAPLELSLDNVYRIEGEIDPETAARNYAQTIRVIIGEPRFDLVLLGMGPDGHTASLFPNSPGLGETERYVIANHVDSPLTKGPATRITLTFPALALAKRVIFLVAGADKADTLQKVLEGPPGVYPSQRVAAADITWFVDDAAAAKLGAP